MTVALEPAVQATGPRGPGRRRQRPEPGARRADLRQRRRRRRPSAGLGWGGALPAAAQARTRAEVSQGGAAPPEEPGGRSSGRGVGRRRPARPGRSPVGSGRGRGPPGRGQRAVLRGPAGPRPACAWLTGATPPPHLRCRLLHPARRRPQPRRRLRAPLPLPPRPAFIPHLTEDGVGGCLGRKRVPPLQSLAC